MKVVVINLEKNNDRLKKISENLDRLNIPFERFRAVYGKEMSKDKIKETTTDNCQNILCNKGIIGCALSHITIWKRFLESNQDFICVLEDDAILKDGFQKFLDDVPSLYEKLNFDIISLYCSGICSSISKEMIDDYTFTKPLFPLGAVCNIISKKGVERLVSYIDKINYNIDYMIAYNKLTDGMDYYYLESPSLVDTTVEESDIANLNDRGILNNVLAKTNLNTIKWFLNLCIFTVKLDKPISVYMIILFLLILIFFTKRMYIITIILIIEFVMVM